MKFSVKFLIVLGLGVFSATAASPLQYPQLQELWITVQSRYQRCEPSPHSKTLWQCTGQNQIAAISVEDGKVQAAKVTLQKPIPILEATQWKKTGWRVAGSASGSQDVVDHSRWIENPSEGVRLKISARGQLVEVYAQKVEGTGLLTLQQSIEAPLDAKRVRVGVKRK